jgi:hypothetical protein
MHVDAIDGIFSNDLLIDLNPHSKEYLDLKFEKNEEILNIKILPRY